MPHAFELSREFYEAHRGLYEGMTGPADGLYSLLAGDIARTYHKEYKTRIGVTTDLAGDALEQARRILPKAFRSGDTAKLREELLLARLGEQIAAWQSNPEAHGPNCSPENLRTAYLIVRDVERKVRDDARKPSGTIEGLSQGLLDRIRCKAEVISADERAGAVRDRTGLAGNIGELISAAAKKERAALAAAFAGLAKASRFATLDIDLAHHRLTSDDQNRAPRNLFAWEDPADLKRHYPGLPELDAQGLDGLSRQIASRINYPFGLVDQRSRNSMLAAIFLVYSCLPNNKVAGLAESVATAAGLSPEQEITRDDAARLALRALGAPYKVAASNDFRGFDFLRIAGAAAIRALGSSAPTGWPAGLVESLLHGPEDTAGPVREAADAVSAALPLTEPDIRVERSWAGSCRWETAGETAARIVRNDPAYRSSAAAPGVDRAPDSPWLSDFGPGALVTSQFDRLLQDFPMEQLLSFRNDLVNSETRKRVDPCIFDGLLSLNAFLKEWSARQLNDRLRKLREERHAVALELRTAAERDAGRRHGQGYVEDLMPDRVIRELIVENDVYRNLRDGLLQDTAGPRQTDAVLEAIHGPADQAGFPGPYPVREPDNILDELLKALTRNDELIGSGGQDPGFPIPETTTGLQVPWLGLLTSPAVSRQLAIFAQADDAYTYSASPALTRGTIEFSGPVLRDTANALQAFTTWAAQRRTLARTLPGALQTYLKSAQDMPGSVQQLWARVTTLAASLILDTHAPSAGEQNGQKPNGAHPGLDGPASGF